MAQIHWWNDVRLDTHWQVRCSLRASFDQFGVVGKIMAMGLDYHGKTCENCGCAIRNEDIAELSQIRTGKFLCHPCYNRAKRRSRP